MKMMDEGKSLKEMRAQIEKTYSKYGPPTPTLPDTFLIKALLPRDSAWYAQKGWNNSIGLPDGSSIKTCLPPFPVTIALRKRAP